MYSESTLLQTQAGIYKYAYTWINRKKERNKQTNKQTKGGREKRKKGKQKERKGRRKKERNKQTNKETRIYQYLQFQIVSFLKATIFKP